jgi:hypothetical protein
MPNPLARPTRNLCPTTFAHRHAGTARQGTGQGARDRHPPTEVGLPLPRDRRRHAEVVDAEYSITYADLVDWLEWVVCRSSNTWTAGFGSVWHERGSNRPRWADTRAWLEAF